MKKILYLFSTILIFISFMNVSKAAGEASYQLIANYQIDGHTFTLDLSNWAMGGELVIYDANTKQNYRVINSDADGYIPVYTPDFEIPNLTVVLSRLEKNLNNSDIYASGKAVAPDLVYVKDNGRYYFLAVEKGVNVEAQKDLFLEAFNNNLVWPSDATMKKSTVKDGIAYKENASGYSAANQQIINKLNSLTDQYNKDCKGKQLSGEAKTNCDNIYSQIQNLGKDIQNVSDSVVTNPDTANDEDLQNQIGETTQTQQVVQNAIIISNPTSNLVFYDFNLKVGCDTVFGGENSEIGEWLKNAFRFIQFVGLALVIILSSLDFIKVISGNKDDELKNAFSRTTKRFIAVALLFLAPVLVQFILGLAGGELTTGNGEPISLCIDFY